MLASKGIFMIAFNLAAVPKARGKAKAFVLQNAKLCVHYTILRYVLQQVFKINSKKFNFVRFTKIKSNRRFSAIAFIVLILKTEIKLLSGVFNISLYDRVRNAEL